MDNTFDRMFYSEGELIGGVDESGVSDIAGPLVAACVVLPKIDIHRDDLRIFEIDDSKKIPEKYRKQHAEVIWQTAVAIGIGEVQPQEIDYLGKQNASRLAMQRSILACRTVSRHKPLLPDFLLIDGDRPVHLNIRQNPVRDGDQKSLCVAAASIVAKVYRDEIMAALHQHFPYYDWINNKGYPCENHFRGIDGHGIQIGIHRIRFWPFVANTMYKEETARWNSRRGGWRRVTREKLSQELGDSLWTIKPPLWSPSKPSSDLPSRGETTGSGTRGESERSRQPATTAASLPSTRPSAKPPAEL